MNFYRIAFKNVRQTINQYYLYFLSLSLLAAFYYIFDALSENIQLDLSGFTGLSGNAFLILGKFFMYLFSFTFIFFTNRFFLKKRWHEIGLYRFLGIKRRQISLLLFFEVILLLSSAFLLGTLLGIFLSKLFAMILLKMIGSMLEAKVLISLASVVQTARLFLFSALFLIAYNTFYLYRHRLVVLLKKSNESISVKRLQWTDFLGSILAIFLLGYGYIQAGEYVTKYQYYFVNYRVIVADNHIFTQPFIILLAIILGTFFFFYSLLPLLLILLKKYSKFYYKGLRMFTLDRLIHYFRNYGAVLSVVSILCGFSLSVLGGSVLLFETFGQDHETRLRYNYVVSSEFYPKFNQELKKFPDFSIEKQSSVKVKVLPAKIKMGKSHKNESITAIDIISKDDFEQSYYTESERSYPLLLNQANSVIDDKYVDLELANEQGKLVNVTFDNDWNQYLSAPYLLVVGQHQFDAIKALEYQINFIDLSEDDFWDKTLQKFDQTISQSDQQTVTFAFEVHEKDQQLVAKKITEGIDFEQNNQIVIQQRGLSIQNQQLNTYHVIFGTLLFVAIFLGLIFLGAAGCLVMLRQLSSAEEEKQNYQVLMQLGIKDKEMKRSLQIQNTWLFFSPIVLSVWDAYFALKMFGVFISFQSVGPAILLLSVLLVVYFLFQIITARHYAAIVLRFK